MEEGEAKGGGDRDGIQQFLRGNKNVFRSKKNYEFLLCGETTNIFCKLGAKVLANPMTCKEAAGEEGKGVKGGRGVTAGGEIPR